MLLEPEGSGRALFIVSITFLILTWLTVGLRLAIRYKIKYLGADDYSMMGGLVCFQKHCLWLSVLMVSKILLTVFCISSIVSVYYGLGSLDSKLTPYLSKEARKVNYQFPINNSEMLTSTIGS